MITKKCLVCGNQFIITKSSGNTAKCCSRKCLLLITSKNIYKYLEGRKRIKKRQTPFPWWLRFYYRKWSLDKDESWDGLRKLQINIYHRENYLDWKGGKTSLDKQIRNLMEYKVWKMELFERDKFTCTKCGKKNK